MITNQISDWYAAPQTVTVDDMTNLSQDLYQRIAQIAYGKLPCILNMAGAITISNNIISIPSGNFIFNETNLNFLTYQTFPIGSCQASSINIANKTGYIVARYTLNPLIEGQTSYKINTTYVYTNVINNATDVLVCAVSNGVKLYDGKYLFENKKYNFNLLGYKILLKNTPLYNMLYNANNEVLIAFERERNKIIITYDGITYYDAFEAGSWFFDTSAGFSYNNNNWVIPAKQNNNFYATTSNNNGKDWSGVLLETSELDLGYISKNINNVFYISLDKRQGSIFTKFFYSQDLTNWQNVTINDVNMYDLIYVNGFYAVGTTGIYFGSDITQLNKINNSPTFVYQQKIMYNNGIFIIYTIDPSNLSGMYYYSNDGINWIAKNLTTTLFESIQNIVFGNGIWVMVLKTIIGGNVVSDKILYSNDGINWTEAILNDEFYTDIASVHSKNYILSFVNNKFIIVKPFIKNFALTNATNQGGALFLYSNDGINWINGNFASFNNQQMIRAIKNDMFYINNVYLFPFYNNTNDANTSGASIGTFNISISD